MEKEKTCEDRRTAYSKKMIRESLYALMKEKPLDKITVTKVCELADVNRSTFYSYYTDIADLHRQILNEFSEKLKITGNKIRDILLSKPDILNLSVDDYYEITYAYLSTVRENKDLCKFIFNQNSSTSVFMGFGRLYFRIVRGIMQPLGMEKELRAFRRSQIFVNGGTTGIIISWLNDNCTESTEKLAKSVAYYYYGIFNATRKRPSS